MLPVETFFRWKPRIELNFTLAPVWGRAEMIMDTKPSDKYEDWNELLNSFGDSNPLTEMAGTDQMVNNWLGYSGQIGIRYYLSSRLGIDFKFGFMNNKYKNDNWRVQRNKVIGPKIDIKKLPVFSVKSKLRNQMRQILFLALILSCSIADNADVKRVKKGKKVKKENQVKDLGPGPCHEPVHPLILQAKAKGIKSIPLKSMSEFRRLLDDCSKTGHKETVKQIKRADFNRDF